MHKFFKKSMSHLKILGANWGRDASFIVRNLVSPADVAPGFCAHLVVSVVR